MNFNKTASVFEHSWKHCHHSPGDIKFNTLATLSAQNLLIGPTERDFQDRTAFSAYPHN